LPDNGWVATMRVILRHNGGTQLFDGVFSRGYVKNYLEMVTGRLQISKRKDGVTSEDQDRSNTGSKNSSTGQSSEEDILRTDRIPQEKELLRRIQEPEYKTEKIKSLVYVA
jgi:hypothetical protein